MKKSGALKWGLSMLLTLLFAAKISVSAKEAQTIYNSPYVTFSPDKKAWTTNAGEKNFAQYGRGTRVSTGMESTLREPDKGEHFYRYARTGTVPVGSWVVSHQYAQCIHNGYLPDGYYHGIQFGKRKCGKYYFSGWLPYCADCKNEITGCLFYMSRAAADSIDQLEMGAGLEYYYTCPHCSNLEQGVPLGAHYCLDISPNQYRVVYHANTDRQAGGRMPYSLHMYNNAEEYEGQPVKPITRLTGNSYTCAGYEFTGWNTEPDGSGTDYEDRAEIFNLSEADWRNDDTWTETDNGTVELYAQWRPSKSTLYVDPNGGAFAGSREITAVTGEYGDAFSVDACLVKAPAGCTVSFDTNGGVSVEAVTGTQHFTEWSLKAPFLGKLDGETYVFLAPDEGEDTIVANYERDPVVLPGAEKEGYAFGGWYYDSSFLKPAGGKGDRITPAEDRKLYAQWVDLTLYAEDNYTVNDGKGAVDLTWKQEDHSGKSYLIYQSQNGADWQKVHAATDIGDSFKVDVLYSCTGSAQEYTVPYTGLYTVTAAGAQGENFEDYSGGSGGTVTVDLWLQKGEVLTCNAGGQNGYNGGGPATDYGSGGGATTVTSDQKGVLIIAGGGGGASSQGDGGQGGSSASLVETECGQEGMAGGGGGARGGSSGQVIRHRHTGSSDRYGGCYTVQTGCGSTSFTQNRRWVDRYNNSNYYDVSTGRNVVGAYCPQCGNHSCSGHDIYETSYTCNSCGRKYANRKPDRCTNQFGYKPDCGYTDGQILDAYPAYGGSSYVNTEWARSYEKKAGVNIGDGTITIVSEIIGFVESNSLNGVTATDRNPPDIVPQNADIEAVTAAKVKLTWRAPKDNGTEYYHMVESFLSGSDVPLSRSNLTKNTLVSGIGGYYYLADTEPFTQVNAMTGQYTEDCWGTAEFSEDGAEQKKYFHVAAVDRAGNLGETAHFSVDNGDGEVPWNLYTKPLEPREGDNVYPAEEDRAWYVKCDGATPFFLNYQSRLDGPATAAYQQNYVIFETRTDSGKSRNVFYIPSDEIRNTRFGIRSEDIVFTQQGEVILKNYPYTVMSRSDKNRELEAVQGFVTDPELSGSRIQVIPIAGAKKKDGMVCSEYEEDLKNGITLIADGKAPVISGLEGMENLDLIDRRKGGLMLTVSAADELSGVKDFYITVYNRDNTAEKIFRPEEDGRIRLELTSEDPVFNGDITLTVHAEDNVGNVKEEVFGAVEFALDAHIERVLAPHDAAFKSGESGVLSFQVWGYADRVEVEFPEEMTAWNPDLNKTFVYTHMPSYLQEEKLQFMIPLNTPVNQNYVVTVRAYKGDRKLEEYPAVSVLQVAGTVLDDFRTRLR